MEISVISSSVMMVGIGLRRGMSKIEKLGNCHLWMTLQHLCHAPNSSAIALALHLRVVVAQNNINFTAYSKSKINLQADGFYLKCLCNTVPTKDVNIVTTMYISTFYIEICTKKSYSNLLNMQLLKWQKCCHDSGGLASYLQTVLNQSIQN